MQFRVNAEDPAKQFMPPPGRLDYYVAPGGPHVRVDSACYAGYTIPPTYDSMIAKLIVKGRNRTEAIARAKRALSEFHIGGVKTTIPFHLNILNQKVFHDADFDLTYVDRLSASGHTFGHRSNFGNAKVTATTDQSLTDLSSEIASAIPSS